MLKFSMISREICQKGAFSMAFQLYLEAHNLHESREVLSYSARAKAPKISMRGLLTMALLNGMGVWEMERMRLVLTGVRLMHL